MKPVTLFLLLAAAAFAQNDGITAYASRTVYVQPDQIEAGITLTTPATVTQQQAATILQNAGVPSRLASAGSAASPSIQVLDPSNRFFDRAAPSFTYSFVHSVTGSDMRDLAKKLETLQNTRSADFSSLTYSTALTVSQAVIDDQFQRLLPQLIADAKKRADVLASAAGLRVGAVQSVTDTSGAALAGQRVAVTGVAAFAFSGVPGFGLQSNMALTFTIAVKFAAN